MSDIGKEFEINTSRDYLNSIGIYEEIVDSKVVLKEEYTNGICVVEAKVKYDFYPETRIRDIMMEKRKLTLIK